MCIDEIKHQGLGMLVLLGLTACTMPSESSTAPAATQTLSATVAQAQPDAASHLSLPFESRERQLHPSGPIVRRYWRAAQDGPVLRMEIDRALSGHALVAGWSLLRSGSQTWQLRKTSSAVPQEAVLPLGADRPVEIVADDGVRWRVQLLSTKEPRVQPGIATEDEASAQVRLDRLTPS